MPGRTELAGFRKVRYPTSTELEARKLIKSRKLWKLRSFTMPVWFQKRLIYFGSRDWSCVGSLKAMTWDFSSHAHDLHVQNAFNLPRWLATWTSRTPSTSYHGLTCFWPCKHFCFPFNCRLTTWVEEDRRDKMGDSRYVFTSV